MLTKSGNYRKADPRFNADIEKLLVERYGLDPNDYVWGGC